MEAYREAMMADPNYSIVVGATGVMAMTTLSIRTIGRLVDEGRFPAPVVLSARRRVWRKSEVLKFLAGDQHWSFPDEPAE